jgi:hypothetical protein
MDQLTANLSRPLVRDCLADFSSCDIADQLIFVSLDQLFSYSVDEVDLASLFNRVSSSRRVSTSREARSPFCRVSAGREDNSLLCRVAFPRRVSAREARVRTSTHLQF